MRRGAALIVGMLSLVGPTLAADKFVTPQEARTWLATIRAAEMRGDSKIVLSMLREESVVYVDTAEYAGEGLALKGTNLKEWLERRVARNKGKVSNGTRCGYEPVPEDGTVIERCVGPARELQASAGKTPGEFIYTVNVIAKDGRGLFAKTGWVSDKKLF